MRKTATLAITLASFLLLAASSSARHPSYDEMRQVKYLAHELYEGSHYLYKVSADYVDYPSYEEKDALRDLHHLSQRAHHFYRQVDHHYRSPRHTEKDFERLIRAHYAAMDSAPYLPTYGHYRTRFHNLKRSMDSLVHYYGGYSYYGRSHRGGHYDSGHRGHHSRPGYYDHDRRHRQQHQHHW